MAHHPYLGSVAAWSLHLFFLLGCDSLLPIFLPILPLRLPLQATACCRTMASQRDRNLVFTRPGFGLRNKDDIGCRMSSKMFLNLDADRDH